MKTAKVKILIESAIMIALSTVLSLIKIIELPYGGSVTIASMLPIIIISYRHGLGWGFAAGTVHGVIQQLLGLKTLSYVTTWQSVVAVIVLDYVLAFAVVGIGGIFGKRVKNQALSLTLGAALACALRHACHVISGATVWAGLSIPTHAALSYSLVYNATYMLPETIITALMAFYIGSSVDIGADNPVRIKRIGTGGASWLVPTAFMLAVIALIFDVCAVFAHLQDPETGTFTLADVGNINVTAVAAVTSVAFTAAFVMMSVRYVLKSGTLRASAAMSLIYNIGIVLSTLYSVHYLFRADVVRTDADLAASSWRAFRYFTVLSNVFVASVSVIVILFTLKCISKNDYLLPKWLLILKFTATVSVSVTLFTVVLFLSPLVAIGGKGYFSLFEKINYFLHFTTPILSMTSFIFFERTDGFKAKHTVLGVIPTFIYSVLYFIMVAVVKQWPDFYGFTFNGKMFLSPIAFVAVIALSYGLASAQRALQNQFVKRADIS